MIPDRAGPHPAVVYLDPRGKSVAAAGGGDAERLVRQGYAVLAPDLSGMGETGRVTDSISFLAMLSGRSVAGLRAGEITRCVQFLKGRRDVDGAAISAVARSGLSVPLLKGQVSTVMPMSVLIG